MMSEPSAEGPARILIVDDDVDSADALAILLECDGYQTSACYDGGQALARIRSEQPSIVLLDVALGRFDGREIARQLRAAGGLNGTCLIALSGYSDSETRQNALAAGFDSYLVKPVELDALRSAITATCERR